MSSLSDIPARGLLARAWQRSAIGLGQGVLLWLLYRAGQRHAWPATQPHLFGPVFLGVLFVPVLAVSGLGNLRRPTLASWLLCALLVLAAAGLNDFTRDQTPAVEPSNGVIGALALALFIAHALVTAGDIDRRPVAAYPIYFDVAWKHVVQLGLSLLFLAFFWGVLWLGAELFTTIGIDGLNSLLTRSAFAMPASALAFAFALHVTDIRVGLVQGIRNSLYLLLSWLLPIAALLIIGFVASLPFTGLAPLWRTSHGSEIVLSAAAVLIALINMVYRDGSESARPALLRWTGSAASLCLPLLVAISAYGLALRVGQHGWSSYRIAAVAGLGVAGSYAAGYAWAAVAGRPWLKPLEATNIVAAGAILAAVVALTTAIADPVRLSVGDQVRRLESGRISPDRFDFEYLRFHSGRYGAEALERLKTAAGPNAEAIRRGAEQALALKSPNQSAPPPSSAELGGMTVFPAGDTLPQSLIRQDWSADPLRYLLPACFFNAGVKCEAFISGSRSGGERIVVAGLAGDQRGVVLQQDAAGVWRTIGMLLSDAIRCETVREALRAGRYSWVPALQQDLEAAGQRLTVMPLPPGATSPNCP